MYISIKDVKVYIVSPGTGAYTVRLLTVFERLMKAGFKQVEFFRSRPSESYALTKDIGVSNHVGTDSLSRTNLAILELELVGGMRRPFIIVEDDVEIFHNCDRIELPSNADALYLGISKWIYPHGYDTLGCGLNIKENGPENVKDAGPDITQIYGMTGAHAILFINPEYVRQFIARMTARLPYSTPHDLVFTTLQSDFNIFAMKKPMFYQDAALGGQEAVTRLIYNGLMYK